MWVHPEGLRTCVRRLFNTVNSNWSENTRLDFLILSRACSSSEGLSLSLSIELNANLHQSLSQGNLPSPLQTPVCMCFRQTDRNTLYATHRFSASSIHSDKTSFLCIWFNRFGHISLWNHGDEKCKKKYHTFQVGLVEIHLINSVKLDSFWWVCNLQLSHMQKQNQYHKLVLRPCSCSSSSAFTSAFSALVVTYVNLCMYAKTSPNH